MTPTLTIWFILIMGILIGTVIGVVIIEYSNKTVVVLTGSITNRNYVVRKSNIVACVENENHTTLVTLKDAIALPEGKTAKEMVVKEHHRYILK